MGRAISISEPVYETLEEVKDQKQHTSFDSALREVLRDAGYEIWLDKVYLYVNVYEFITIREW